MIDIKSSEVLSSEFLRNYSSVEMYISLPRARHLEIGLKLVLNPLLGCFYIVHIQHYERCFVFGVEHMLNAACALTKENVQIVNTVIM